MHKIGYGARLGAITGMVLAGAYAVLALAVMGVIAASGTIADGSGIFALPLLGGVAMCGWPLAVVLGLLPGIVLGAVGGAVIGGLLAMLPRLSPVVAILPGALVGCAVAVGNHVLLGPGFLADYAAGRSTLLPYFFWIVGPGILLVLGGGWVSGWVSSRITRLQ